MSKIAEGVPGPSSGLPLRTQSEENHMNLGALFKVIDTDKSGTIDLHEFKLAW
jgi:Ca2+-binding EF-hand superfamily protein